MIAHTVNELLDDYDSTTHNGLILTLTNSADKVALRRYLSRFGDALYSPDYCGFIKFVPKDRKALTEFSREYFEGLLPAINSVEPSYAEPDDANIFCKDT